jgi:DNA-binding MarR family transcriptional regulator
MAAEARDSLITTARPRPADSAPSNRVGDVLGLLDDLSVVVELADRLLRGIEQLTGLRPGEIRVVLALSAGARPLDEVARQIGETDPATAGAVDDMVGRGVLERRNSNGEAVRLTETGVALLEQIQGVQVRLLDALAEAAGESGVQVVRTTLQAFAKVAGTVGDHADRVPRHPSAPESRSARAAR